jgi:hypothetical protein
VPGEGKPVSDTKVIAGPDGIKAAMHEVFISCLSEGFRPAMHKLFGLPQTWIRPRRCCGSAKNGYTWPAVRWTGSWRRVDLALKHEPSELVAGYGDWPNFPFLAVWQIGDVKLFTGPPPRSGPVDCPRRLVGRTG